MTALPTDLRSRLENAVKEARAVAENGARQALEALAVGRREPHGTMTAEERSLRNRLRAHGRQLGDTRKSKGTQTIDRVVREVAYEHWHRMLFARFLAENHLLIEPSSSVAITMEECRDLARERNEDPWALAASFAQAMLPQIFRTDDPALQVTLPPETRQTLQRLLASLSQRVFTEDDALGWTYQFWQSAEKDAVNARVKSGEKITGETLPAVTQLFTEPYMVRFLLHNTLGAWHAGRVLPESLRKGARCEGELRRAARLSPAGGYDFEYLRFVRGPEQDHDDGGSSGPWRPAAGTFERWPTEASDLRVLDPCCGSGHFLVEAFQILVRLRIQEEGLDLEAAARAVIAENLFGLELDARCTQIAAFNLALAAWKLVGVPIDLPPMRIACSGIGPQASREEWLRLAEQAAAAGGIPGKRDLFGSEDTLLTAGVRGGLEALYDLFEKAPDLGSLIDPRAIGQDASQLDALQAGFAALEPLLDAILRREGAGEEEMERAVAAKGMAEAARILAGPEGGYTLVTTNVPYLGRGSHTDAFKRWAETYHNEAKNDLATIFVSRMLRWVGNGDRPGTVAAVTPQNWLFLTTYRKFRERLLKERAWEMVARLGPGAFETISGHVVNVALIALSGRRPADNHIMAGIDAMAAKTPGQKAVLLRGDEVHDQRVTAQVDLIELTPDDGAGEVDAAEEDRGRAGGAVRLMPQAKQLKNPDARILLKLLEKHEPLSQYAVVAEGLHTGDYPRFGRKCWELPVIRDGWELQQGGTSDHDGKGGCEHVLFWEGGRGALIEFVKVRLDSEAVTMWIKGEQVWGRRGIAVGTVGELRHSLYHGALFTHGIVAIVAHQGHDAAPLLAYIESLEFRKSLRRLDQKLAVARASFDKVPFDLPRWRRVAEEKYPDGLPEPYSDDPTQWLFHGHPVHAQPGTKLQVAVARVLGYRWPAELDSEMRLSDEARTLIERSRQLDGLGLADDDGIVCFSPVRGEPSVADRLRSLLAAAFGSNWSAAKERELLAAAANSDHGTGKRATTLDEWLRGSFFEEHCKLFHHRPFIWHIWDGLTDGFNALVNYHCLAGPEGQGRRTLESLTFTYLGDWIERQRAAQQAGKEGSDARLAAAFRLQQQLQKILEGEPPYDLFIRWKPLREQPIGWDPDISDGVVLNIRPFMMAEDVRYKGAGVLRRKPNVKWTKDRGKEPESLRSCDDFPWFWGCDPKKYPRHRTDFGAQTPGATPAGPEFDGVRWNALHYTRAAKEVARERARAEVDA